MSPSLLPSKTTPAENASKLPSSFLTKKARILSSLSTPTEQYDDLSPKGSVDVGIRDLIDEINALDGCVTTSSCAGRVSVFLEGRKKVKKEKRDVGSRDETVDGESRKIGDGDGEVNGFSGAVVVDRDDEKHEDEYEGGVEDVMGDVTGSERAKATSAGIGGKGGGGRWLFVSHDPIDLSSLENSLWAEYLGMNPSTQADDSEAEASLVKEDTRFIHFKFEPMILHILTASLTHANLVLSAALQAGFRESGALNLVSPSSSYSSSSSSPVTPMVGIRTNGLSLSSLIGYHHSNPSTTTTTATEEEGGENRCIIPEYQLRNLITISNQRFEENTRRIERFRRLLGELMRPVEKEEVKMGDSGVWEGKEERRARKREEGLRRAALARSEGVGGGNVTSVTELASLDLEAGQ